MWRVVCSGCPTPVMFLSCIALCIITPFTLQHEHSKKWQKELLKSRSVLVQEMSLYTNTLPWKYCMQREIGKRSTREEDLHRLESLCLCFTSAALQRSHWDPALDPTTLWQNNPLNTISVQATLSAKHSVLYPTYAVCTHATSIWANTQKQFSC